MFHRKGFHQLIASVKMKLGTVYGRADVPGAVHDEAPLSSLAGRGAPTWFMFDSSARFYIVYGRYVLTFIVQVARGVRQGAESFGIVRDRCQIATPVAPSRSAPLTQ